MRTTGVEKHLGGGIDKLQRSETFGCIGVIEKVFDWTIGFNEDAHQQVACSSHAVLARVMQRRRVRAGSNNGRVAAGKRGGELRALDDGGRWRRKGGG